MFSYIFTNFSPISSIVTGITIIQDVITFFLKINLKKSSELLSSKLLKPTTQCAKECSGESYDYIEQDDYRHTLRDLHPDNNLPPGLTQEDKHYHLSACNIITPDHFRCLLDQLVTIQSDLNFRELNYFDRKRLNQNWISSLYYLIQQKSKLQFKRTQFFMKSIIVK